MPMWWKRKCRSKSSKKGAAAPAGSIPTAAAIGEVNEVKGKKKATSFDEVLLVLAKGVHRKQQPPLAAGEVIGLPLPCPAFLPAPLPSASASASVSTSSVGGSSLGSSTSDEQLDIGVYR